MKTLILGVLLLIVAISTACSGLSRQPATAITNENLKAQIDQVSKDLNDIKERSNMQEVDISRKAWLHDFAWFTPDQHGFERIGSNYGSFLVSIEDVKPYLDGFNVSFQIGNTTSAAHFLALVLVGPSAVSGVYSGRRITHDGTQND